MKSHYDSAPLRENQFENHDFDQINQDGGDDAEDDKATEFNNVSREEQDLASLVEGEVSPDISMNFDVGETVSYYKTSKLNSVNSKLTTHRYPINQFIDNLVHNDDV